MLPLAADPGVARDPDGRYANSAAEAVVRQSEEREGTMLFRRGRTRAERCRLGIDNGHYRVRIDGEWLDVPDDAVITEPIARANHGLADARLSRIEHPLLHAGQHDVVLPYAPTWASDTPECEYQSPRLQFVEVRY